MSLSYSPPPCQGLLTQGFFAPTREYDENLKHIGFGLAAQDTKKEALTPTINTDTLDNIQDNEFGQARAKQ